MYMSGQCVFIIFSANFYLQCFLGTTKMITHRITFVSYAKKYSQLSMKQKTIDQYTMGKSRALKTSSSPCWSSLCIKQLKVICHWSRPMQKYPIQVPSRLWNDLITAKYVMPDSPGSWAWSGTCYITAESESFDAICAISKFSCPEPTGWYIKYLLQGLRHAIPAQRALKLSQEH